MKRAAIAGFSAGIAMMIGGALAAVSTSVDTRVQPDAEVMNPMVGGQAMMPERDIMANMASSPMHAKLVAALNDSGVAAALKQNGQFTLFAPTDTAFTPGSKASLAQRMSYLIVPGSYDSQTLLRVIGEGGGEARLHTVEGGVLIARMNGPTNITLMDERGNIADIAIYDIHDRNGVVQVIDRMMEPAGPARQIASR